MDGKCYVILFLFFLQYVKGNNQTRCNHNDRPFFERLINGDTVTKHSLDIEWRMICPPPAVQIFYNVSWRVKETLHETSVFTQHTKFTIVGLSSGTKFKLSVTMCVLENFVKCTDVQILQEFQTLQEQTNWLQFSFLQWLNVIFGVTCILIIPSGILYHKKKISNIRNLTGVQGLDNGGHDVTMEPISEVGCSTECIVCMERPKSHVLVPCGHLKLCGPCIATHQFPKCPTCNTPVNTHVRIFS